MRQFILEQPEKLLTLRETLLPPPGPGEVLVRIHAVSLNFRDALILAGHYPLPVKNNLVPLSDGAGEILAIGEGVTALNVGDRVVSAFFPDWQEGAITAENSSQALGGTADGVLADRVLLPATAVQHFPDHLTFEQAATLPCAALTAWNALVAVAAIGPQDTVLVLGTGGVSMFALQLAKALGATVIQTSSSDDKLGKVSAMGADHVINYRTTPNWSTEVLRMTGGKGVDVVVEVGGPGTLAHSMASVRLGGTIAAVGFVGGLGQVDILPLMVKAANLRAILVGSRSMFADMAGFMHDQGLIPVVDSVFPVDAFQDALARLAQGPFGKVVVSM